MDGVKLFNSVMSESWPILYRCANLVDSRPSVLGIFYGDGKPVPLDDYLADSIADLKDLKENGVSFQNDHYEVDVRFYLGDAPARAMLKGIVGHTSKDGCVRCDQEGEYDYEAHHVIYSTKIGNERTDESFEMRRDPEHHKIDSPLSYVQIRFISQVPLEPMHIIDIGASWNLC